jgi:spectrin alpha
MLQTGTFCNRQFFSQLLERRNALLEKSALRRAILEDSYRLQQFERDCDETKGWINEKLKFATDDSYLVRISGFLF